MPSCEDRGEVPSESEEILLMLLRQLAWRWKNFVLESPTLSHCTRDHCRHLSSSCNASSSKRSLSIGRSERSTSLRVLRSSAASIQEIQGRQTSPCFLAREVRPELQALRATCTASSLPLKRITGSMAAVPALEGSALQALTTISEMAGYQSQNASKRNREAAGKNKKAERISGVWSDLDLDSARQVE